MAMTPESLIASLQSSLSHHGTLLPQLHAQLGLPPSALTYELEQLQSTLCEVVEGQITHRRNEVDEWMAKCEGVEQECLKLVKCLGTCAKNLASVGELRKITILPRRHEQLIVHQEKLEQLYNSRSEQFVTLNNRLLNVSQTLGAAFFPSDILSPSPVDLSSETGPSSTSDDPSRQGSQTQIRVDVTPERYARLEKELMRGKAEITRRLIQLSSALENIVWYYTELGMPLPTPDVTSNAMVLDAEDETAPSTSSLASGSSLKRRAERDFEQILARFIARWEEAEDEALEGDTLGVEGVDPTVAVMEWAEKLKAELEVIKSHRESRIQTVFDQLESLWKRLGIEEEDINAFVDANRGSTEENVQAYEAELERMLELRKEGMSTIITNARKEISQLWDDIIVGEAEREEFAPFYDDEHTEELLARHEEEITKLKEEKRTKSSLLISITKYFDICEEERQLTESAADQSRLLGRGPRGDPGRLLREEKMRKRVKKEKPRLEQELLQSIPAWEEQYGRSFLINGVRVVDVLMESAEATASKESTQKKRSTRQVSATIPARATTPGPQQTSTAISSRKHAATPSRSVSQSVPSKRQRLNNGGSMPPASTTRPPSTTPTFGMSTSSNRSGPTTVPLGSSRAANLAQPLSHHPSSKSGMKSTAPCTPGGEFSYKPPPSSHKQYGGANLGLGLPSSTRNVRTVSNTSSMTSLSVKSGRSGSAAPVRMVAAKKRESFRPRPSIDASVFGMGGMKNYGRIIGAAPSGREKMLLVDVSEDLI